MFEIAYNILYKNCLNLLNLIISYAINKKKIYLTVYSLDVGISLYILIILKILQIENIELFLYGCPSMMPKVLNNIISKHIININNKYRKTI